MQKKKIKNNVYLVLGLFLLFTFLPLVCAIDYNKVFVSPFYTENIIENVSYNYTISIDTNSYVKDVSSAVITFKSFISSTPQKFYLTVNGQSCNNPYYISSSLGESNIVFDCSNIILSNGNYDLVLSSDKNSSSIFGWIDFYYSSAELGRVEVHGTEYTIGQTAKPFLQLLNGDGNIVENSICYVSVYTPNNQIYLQDVIMSNLGYDGIYYRDFDTSSFVDGVYPVVAKCYYEAKSIPYNASSYSFFAGKVDSGILSDTYLSDEDYFKIDTQKAEPTYNKERIDMNFTFSDFYSNCGSISEELLNGISVYWKGKWNTGNSLHDVNIYVYNYSSMSWIILPNEVAGGFGGDVQENINSFNTNNITKLLGLSSSNPMKVRFFDTETGEGKKNFDIDRFYVSCDQLSNSKWQVVMGSNEIHISKPFNFTEFAEGVWTYDNRTLTQYGEDVNYTLIEDLIVENVVDINYSLVEDLIIQYANDDNTNYSLLQNLIIEYANNDNTNYSLMEYLITQYANEDTVNYTLINDLIIQYANDDNTNYSMIEYIVNNYNVDNTNYTLIQNLISDYANNDTTNYSFMQYLVTNYGNDDSVNYSLMEDIVNSYNIDNTNYSLMQYIVENYGNDDSTNYTLMQFLISEYGNDDVNNYTLIQELISQYGNENAINYTLIEEITQFYGNDDVTNYTLIENLLSQYAENDPTNYTLIQELINEYSLTASDIWNYNGTISSNILNSLSNSIWSLFNSTYDFTTMIAESVWIFDNKTLSNNAYENIAQYVWSSENRNLTFYQVNNISVEDIWSYMDRNLTFYPEQEEINYSSIADYVWMYSNRNLTNEYINNISIEDIWSYYNRSLTQDLPLEIWSYENRNLTTDIPFEIWNYYNRTLTYYTVNLTDLIEQINDYEFVDDVIFGGEMGDSITNNQLNVVLYVEK